MHSIIYSFSHSIILFIHTFFHLCIHTFYHSCIYAFYHLFIHTFFHLCIYAFYHSCIYAFYHLIIYAFKHLRIPSPYLAFRLVLKPTERPVYQPSLLGDTYILTGIFKYPDLNVFPKDHTQPVANATLPLLSILSTISLL